MSSSKKRYGCYLHRKETKNLYSTPWNCGCLDVRRFLLHAAQHRAILAHRLGSFLGSEVIVIKASVILPLDRMILVRWALYIKYWLEEEQCA